MRDHTYNGVPVAEMSAQDIDECLRSGVEIIFPDDFSEAEAVEAVMERLRLELFIRENNLRGGR